MYEFIGRDESINLEKTPQNCAQVSRRLWKVCGHHNWRTILTGGLESGSFDKIAEDTVGHQRGYYSSRIREVLVKPREEAKSMFPR
jgi:hypothetical protein